MTIPTTGLSETTPAGSEALNLGDNRIREYKTQNREILEVNHVYPSSGQDADAGKHKKVSLIEQADLGTGASGKPILGAQTVSSKAELLFTDEDNNDVQITSNGKLHAPSLGGVYPAANVADLATMMNFIYPVGSVLTFGVSTNPATLLGIGTWTAIAGKVIVGIDAGQTEFDTLDETGGAKTVTLTAAESGLPAHAHTVTGYNASGTGNNWANTTSISNDFTLTTDTIAAANASSAHNNLQPYIIKYVWQRTA